MRIVTIAIFFALGASSLANSQELDCTTFLTGKWAGEWSGSFFMQPALFNATASYNADGTFTSEQIVSAPDSTVAAPPPLVMSAEGQWTAEQGEDENTCVIDLDGTASMGELGEGPATDLIVIRVDDNTIRNGGKNAMGEPVEAGDLTRVKD